MSGLFDTQDDLAEWENMEDGIDRPEPEAEGEPVPTPAEDKPDEETDTEPDAEPEPDEPAAEPEQETEPEPEPEADDAAALRAQIEKLEQRLADKDDFNGRLSNELGELRAQQQQLLEQTQRPQVGDWDSLIDENPARAAQIALQAGDTYRYQQAKEAWEDLAPGAPDLFEHNLRMQQQMQALEQRVTQSTQPLQAQQNINQVADAYQQMRAKYPEFEQLEDAMVQTIETDPLMKEAFNKVILSGDFDSQFKALESIYLVTAGRNTDTLRDAGKQIAQEHAAETLRAKQEAQVASASANIDTDRPKTPADVIGDEWDEMEKARSDGWNIGPGAKP